MMTNQNTYTAEQYAQAHQEVELKLANAKADVNKAEALKRLFENDDFKLIIKEEFFEKYFKQVSVLVASNRNKDMIEHGVSQMKSVQHLRDFFNSILLQGGYAQQFIDVPYEEHEAASLYDLFGLEEEINE